jgi:hypothetical protein
MRLSFLFLWVFNPSFGQIQSENTLQHWRHGIRATAYTINVIHFGGSELDYELSYAINMNTRIIGRLGFFLMTEKSETGRPDMKYNAVPGFIGIQQVVTQNKKGYLELNLGSYVLNYNDSRAMREDNYFLNYEEANRYDNFYRRFTLIQQFTFGYRINKHFTASIGETAYFVKRLSTFDTERLFAFSPGFLLGAGYTF